METFSALLALCAGNSPVTGEFPTQRPVTRSFDVFYDLRLNKRLSKQLGDGDLNRHRAHYDVTVMVLLAVCFIWRESDMAAGQDGDAKGEYQTGKSLFVNELNLWRIQNTYCGYSKVPVYFFKHTQCLYRWFTNLEGNLAPTYTGDEFPRGAVYNCFHEIRDSSVRISNI